LAVGSLFALLDDIATLLDDVFFMTKVAAKQTAGVLGDDLALNAEQVSGVKAERELPVVWAVAKGSLRNKLILVPAALALSAFAPWAVTPLLMIGGAYLCYEGFEKIIHPLLHPPTPEDHAHHQQEIQALIDPDIDLVAFEQDKIQGAIRTDFVLSAEIIVIALGTVQDASFPVQAAVVAGIALLMTVFVYGLVAGIVRLDDAGLYLIRSRRRSSQWLGRLILRLAPLLMKFLSLVGTAAMFLVGGGILTHGLPLVHVWLEHAQAAVGGLPGIGLLAPVTPLLFNLIAGVLSGALVLGLVKLLEGPLAKLRGGNP